MKLLMNWKVLAIFCTTILATLVFGTIRLWDASRGISQAGNPPGSWGIGMWLASAYGPVFALSLGFGIGLYWLVCIR